ncbi:ferredoxin reductase family protein [Agrococcus sp. SL85]|uniref:ferredoxin reductase family protein n=1 Tax=Agrococcus sp. SL85 TaxID=2995141 RepID=UPI00226CD7ED|nr:ferredoxin reductase family protein [Agrococcus sp. SL85]WAC66053.1 ferredoxin reductase family protein [Agrococcus sp. SL85]
MDILSQQRTGPAPAVGAVGAAPTAAPAPVVRTAPDRRREAWRLAAIAVIWVTSTLVATLWSAGGGVQELLRAPAGTLDSLGRLTGLVSANLLLLQVLLMARVPLFERGLGHAGMVRMHRVVGMWSFWLLVAHIVLLVLGYAADSGLQPLVQLWELVWGYPGMLLATAGTLLLVLVMVTSARRARRRLRYESWHLLHLYGYLGVALAIPHMLWTGTDLATPLAAGYWWALWLATAAAVLVWRIALPIGRSLRHDLRVVAVEDDGARGVRVRIGGRAIERLGARAGQFLVWRFLDGPGWTRGNPYSLAVSPRRGELVIAARVVGDGSRRLRSLRPGTRVLVEGPMGRMTGDARQGRRMLLVGAGAGVAPLLSILDDEAFEPGEAVLVTRDRTPEEAVGAEHVRELVERRGLRHVPLDGPRSRAGSSWVASDWGAWDGAALLRAIAGDLADVDVFLCGPDDWSAALRADLLRAGAAPARIHAESFTS